MFLFILVLASVSLIVIIHNSFAVSMNARIHQFGIFSSIGATPKQIRTCLLQEAASLCALPLFVGSLLGVAGGGPLLRRVAYRDHVVGHAVHLFFRGGGGADGQAFVDLHGVGGDHLAAVPLGQLHRQPGFP